MSNEKLPDEGDESNQLPAERLCNRQGAGEKNPIFGDGALGNESTGKMLYRSERGDKEKLVTILQRMLRNLNYDLGTSGPEGDGVDGKFGNNTEDAVKQFQQEHKDWNGEPLKVDGLVGPETSDALNREMVSLWYRHYQTPAKLVEGMPYHAAMSEYLKEGLQIEPGGAQMGKVFLIGLIPVNDRENIVIEWPNEYTECLPLDLTLELASVDRTVQVRWSSGSPIKEMRRFVFENAVARGQLCTLMAYGAGRSLRLWNNQLATDPDNPPSWEHWLEELFIDQNVIHQ